MFTHIPGDRHYDPNPSRVRVPVFRVPLWAYLPWLAFKWSLIGAWKLILGLVVLGKFWWATLPVLAVTVPLFLYGWEITLGACLLFAGGLGLWWWKHPASFWKGLGWFYLAKWREYRVYRRLWQPTITNVGLAISFDGDRYYPSIIKVRRDEHGDTLTVRLLPGQHPDDWTKQAGRFAHTFNVLSCTASTDGAKPGRIVLRMRTSDSLAAIVAPLPIPAVPDLKALPVAKRSHGGLLTVSVVEHVLIAGATGSGKGSVLWSIVSALAESIRTGLVRVYAFDPKGGMELAHGAPLFAQFHYDQPEQMAGALEDLVKAMKTRTDRLRGGSRSHTATLDDPTVIVLIDELAALTAYVGDKKTKDRIREALSILLSQGRAPGFHVIAAVQDPRKEILPFRELFGTRIALRLTEEAQVDLVLGDGAADRGATCHRIPVSMPGIGYNVLEGRPHPVRARFPFHSDDDVKALAHAFRAPLPGEVIAP